MNKPVITVLLTTYRRPDLLKLAIKSVLRQKHIELELIVIDDHSKDSTQSTVKSFVDSRIRYIENKKNFGFPGVFKKGVELSRGEYIFLLSDDDLIVRDDTLNYVYRMMKRKKALYGQTGLMFYDTDPRAPYRWATPHILKTVYFPPSKSLLFNTRRWHFGFASGNIYKTDIVNKQDIIDDIWFSHVKPIYRALARGSALYFGDYFILGRISKTGNVSYLNISVNKEFHMEKMFSLYREFDGSSTHLKAFKKMHLEEGGINNFVGIKFYTSNKNVLEIARAILRIDPIYTYYLFFWINLFAALIIPKSVISYLRDQRIRDDQKKLTMLLKKIKFWKYLRGTIHT